MLRRNAAFFASCLLAFASGHMVNYGVILYLQETVGSDLLAGVGFGLCFGLSVILGWYAGVLCDRVPPTRLIHAGQGAFVLGLALLFAADAAIDVPVARASWVLAAAALAGVGWSFVSPARMATLAQIVTAAELRPASVVFNLLVMMGFGLGPVLIGTLRSAGGWPAVFIGAASGFGAASLLLLPVHTRAAGAGGRSVLHELREGFSAVAATPILAQLLLAGVLAYAMMGPLQVLLPRLARLQLGLDEFQRGLYLGLLALALIAGGVLCLALMKALHHGRTIITVLALAGVTFAALGNVASPALSAALLGAIGIAGGIVVSLIAAGIQANAAAATRGRVLSMFAISSQFVPAASGLLASAALAALGLVTAIHLAGGLLAACAVLAAFSLPALRAHRA